MIDVARKRATYAEQVAIANDSDVKYEYITGEIVAMAGGSVARSRLISRVTALLHRVLDGRPCIALPSDMCVRIRAADRATYPDLLVVCGEPERDRDDDHAVVNPTVSVEVLSGSSNESGPTDKLAAYRRLGSLRE
jgi:Uma2 family endonuclease